MGFQRLATPWYVRRGLDVLDEQAHQRVQIPGVQGYRVPRRDVAYGLNGLEAFESRFQVVHGVLPWSCGGQEGEPDMRGHHSGLCSGENRRPVESEARQTLPSVD